MVHPGYNYIATESLAMVVYDNFINIGSPEWQS